MVDLGSYPKSVWLPEIWDEPIRNRFSFPKSGSGQMEIGLASRNLAQADRKSVWFPENWRGPNGNRFGFPKFGMHRSGICLASRKLGGAKSEFQFPDHFFGTSSSIQVLVITVRILRFNFCDVSMADNQAPTGNRFPALLIFYRIFLFSLVVTGYLFC